MKITFKPGQFCKYNSYKDAYILKCRNENDLLLRIENGNQYDYMWAVNVELNDETYLKWDRAFYFDDPSIIPEIDELLAYAGCPFIIADNFSYALDQDAHYAALIGSNFMDDECPIDQWVEIPAFINFNGQNYPVKDVANWSFYQNQQITHLKLPETIERIGYFAFAYSSIKELDVKNPLVIDEQSIFYRCKQLDMVGYKNLMDVEYFYNMDLTELENSEDMEIEQ